MWSGFAYTNGDSYSDGSSVGHAHGNSYINGSSLGNAHSNGYSYSNGSSVGNAHGNGDGNWCAVYPDAQTSSHGAAASIDCEADFKH